MARKAEKLKLFEEHTDYSKNIKDKINSKTIKDLIFKEDNKYYFKVWGHNCKCEIKTNRCFKKTSIDYSKSFKEAIEDYNTNQNFYCNEINNEISIDNVAKAVDIIWLPRNIYKMLDKIIEKELLEFIDIIFED